MREAEGVDEGELTALFAERTEGKCILFAGSSVNISIGGKADISRSYRRKRKIPSVCAKRASGDGA